MKITLQNQRKSASNERYSSVATGLQYDERSKEAS